MASSSRKRYTCKPGCEKQLGKRQKFKQETVTANGQTKLSFTSAPVCIPNSSNI